MTWREVRRWVLYWRKALGFATWEFGIEKLPKSCGDVARARWSQCYDTATLSFREDYGEWDLLQAQQHIVHEFVHLLMRDLSVCVSDILGEAPPPVRDVLRRRFEVENERLVERLARRIVEAELR